MTARRNRHSLAVRCLHWINVPLLFLMLWSGLMIYWANPVYRVGFGTHTLIVLFPDTIFSALGVPFRLAEGMSLHFFFMWWLAINGFVYVCYLAVSGEWRDLAPDRAAFTHAIRDALRNWRHVEKAPEQYNRTQRILYTAVIVIGAGSVMTGIAIYKPVQAGWLTMLVGGYEWARWEHFWLAACLVGFVSIHLVQVARAGWKTVVSMIAGDPE
jgi:thiosulfate reductase cytochrome b subunit